MQTHQLPIQTPYVAAVVTGHSRHHNTQHSTTYAWARRLHVIERTAGASLLVISQVNVHSRRVVSGGALLLLLQLLLLVVVVVVVV